MKSCKDCLSCDVCVVVQYSNEPHKYDNLCDDFLDKSLYYKFPCPLGSVVYEVIKRSDDFSGYDYYIVSQKTFALSDVDRIGKTLFITPAEAEAYKSNLENI